jgi:trimethylamine--corrinoid protein Co-methyltransferase
MIRAWADTLKPIDTSDAALAVDAILSVNPGGHFFGAAHTLERFEHAFYQPMVSDWRNFETWREDGAKDATRRAHDIYKRLLAEYQEPAMDRSVDEALKAHMARRKEALEGRSP